MAQPFKYRAAVGPLFAVLLTAGFTGCAMHPRTSVTPSAAVGPVLAAHMGRPYTVIPAKSGLTVLVYRAGPLASLGHNHVITCRCISGTVYVPRDLPRASFDLQVPVQQLIVDDPTLRAAERSPAFPPDVSPSARRGTRRNMLGPAVLDAVQYPVIELRTERLRRSLDGRRNEVLADVQVEVRGRLRSITLPVHYERLPGEVVASGNVQLQQTALGLAPFSVMMGALSVENRMTVRFRVVALAAKERSK